MATQVPRTATMNLPMWFWGGQIPGYMAESRLLLSRAESPDGTVTLSAMERGGPGRPGLVAVRDLAGPTVAGEHFDVLAAADATVPFGAVVNPERIDQVNEHLERLMARAVDGSGAPAFAATFSYRQLHTLLAEPADIAATLKTIYDDIKGTPMLETGEPTFPHASVHFIYRGPALVHRTKLAAVLLRMQHDELLRTAKLAQVMEANARGDLIFAAATDLGDGVMLLDAYLAPLLGALTPWVWAIPAVRTSGTVLFALGRAVSGTANDAAEPLQLLSWRGSHESRQVPRFSARASTAAITWWVHRLDTVMSIMSDPAVYCDTGGTYVPSKHLHAQLSIEQLFRRTASIQRADRDGDARRVLLFTVLDTLEKLTSRSLTTMCRLSFARRTLANLRKGMSVDVAQILLPAAERAVAALAELQSGFFMQRQLGTLGVEFEDSAGVVENLTLEDAAAEYVRVLRNATHGHGSNREDGKLRTDALLAHHTGQLHHDLPLLSYLYLLDLMVRSTELRQTLYDGGRV